MVISIMDIFTIIQSPHFLLIRDYSPTKCVRACGPPEALSMATSQTIKMTVKLKVQVLTTTTTTNLFSMICQAGSPLCKGWI